MEELKSGDSWELQLRGCSIWAVEMLRRQIVSDHPEAKTEVNAVLLDFLLYDLAKEFESTGTLRAVWRLPPCKFMRIPARQPSPRQPISVQNGRLHRHTNDRLMPHSLDLIASMS